jgi:Fe-S oxidoreductase
VSADPGCMMQIEGRAQRTGAPVTVMHLASLLAEAL